MDNNKHHYKIVFSIPIHERFDVVLDQCLNFIHFNPECAIVFHVSKVFNYDDARISYESFHSIIKSIGGIYINPTSLRTGLLDIIQAHLSNFEYISKLCDFDYFSMSASNDLFIREGVFDEMKHYDAGLAYNKVEKNTLWEMGKLAHQDENLQALINHYGGGEIFSSQIEGSYYKTEIYAKICQMINSFYDYKKMTIKYAREEIYFSTALGLIDKHIGLHINKNGIYTWVNWKSKTLFVSISDVNKLVKEHGQYYCVKRCDRDIDNVLRVYIRQRFNYFDAALKFIPGLKKQSNFQILYKEILRNIHNAYDKIIIDIKRKILKVLRK